jgi:hypothetical protein
MGDDDISLLIQKFDKDGNSLFDKVVPNRAWLLSMSCVGRECCLVRHPDRCIASIKPEIRLVKHARGDMSFGILCLVLWFATDCQCALGRV